MDQPLARKGGAMNTELKALISLVVGVVKAGIDVYEGRGYMAAFSNVQRIAGFIVPVISNWSSIQKEIQDLKGTDQERDLLAYIAQEMNVLVTDPKAQMVLKSALQIVTDLTIDSNSLIQTVQALKAPSQTK